VFKNRKSLILLLAFFRYLLARIIHA